MSSERFNINLQTLNKLDFKLLYISTSKYEGEWQSLPHTHSFTELFYVINGNGNFLVEKEIITVKESDLVIVSPNTEHTEMSLNARPLEYIVFGVEGLAFDFASVTPERNYGLYRKTFDKTLFLNFSRIMLQEISEKQDGYELICHDILEVLLIHLTRSCKIELISVPSQNMSKECALAKRYLDTNYHQNITLDSLAEATHINKYYLAHSFSDCLGMSPINYLIQRRLQVGRELLLSTNHSISQITSLTGFSSQSYFSQIFKKYMGISPLQFRKQNSLN